jgi:hypothetical protein
MKYRTTGAWGAGEGRPLTSAEIDQNFYDLDQRIDTLETDTGTNPIANIYGSGSNLYVTLESGTVFGPIAMPVTRWRDAGAWAAGRQYYANDVVTIAGDGIYHVLVDHVSDNEFDSAAINTSGALYSLLIQVPNPAPIVTVTAASLILTSDHANSYVRCLNASGTIVYIEAGTFDAPTEIHFRQASSGPITFAYGSSGTLINVPAGYDMATNAVGATLTLKCVGDNEFDIFGNLAEASA